MRILHTADLHLGRQFMGLSLEEDHEVILGQILETLVAERADVLVIAGDVFDRASPPNSSIRQFNCFLKRVAEETEAAAVMISGNHDSGDRIEAMSVFSTASRVLVRGARRSKMSPRCSSALSLFTRAIAPLVQGRVRGINAKYIAGTTRRYTL